MEKLGRREEFTYEGTGRANFSTMSKGVEPPSWRTVERRVLTVCWMWGRVESMWALVKIDSTILLFMSCQFIVTT